MNEMLSLEDDSVIVGRGKEHIQKFFDDEAHKKRLLEILGVKRGSFPRVFLDPYCPEDKVFMMRPETFKQMLETSNKHDFPFNPIEVVMWKNTGAAQ